MLTLEQRYQLAKTSEFKVRVTAALTKAAIAVQSEATTVTFHDKRSAFAFNVLPDPENWGAVIAFGVAMSEAITSETITDDLLQTTVNGLITAYAIGGV